jgi:HK97 family phage prohead protease
MQLKTRPAQLKALDHDGDPPGTFEALVSVFGNVDDVGDRVLPGAFTNTLGRWAAKGNPIPIIWSHDWSDPRSIVGKAVEATETDAGLLIKGQLRLGSGYADDVYDLLKQRIVTNFSFAYDEVKANQNESDPSIRDLHELELFEVGPCLVGVNPATELMAVKANKQGRTLSAANEKQLRSAVALIVSVLKSVDGNGDNNGNGDGDDDGKAKADALDALIAQMPMLSVADRSKLAQAMGSIMREMMGGGDEGKMQGLSVGGVKGAISSHSTSTDSESGWDAGAARRNIPDEATASTYKQVFAYQDPEADPDTVGAYKFPHHNVSSDGKVGPANIAACSTGVGILNGGRGGADVTGDERQGIYNHLARHMSDAGIASEDIPTLKYRRPDGQDRGPAGGPQGNDGQGRGAKDSDQMLARFVQAQLANSLSLLEATEV